MRALISIATRHQSHIERLKSAEVSKIDTFLKYLDAHVRQKLQSESITDHTRARIEKLLVQIRELISGDVEEYARLWRDSVAEFARYEAGFESRALKNVMEGVEFAMPSDQQILSAVFNTPLGDIGGPDGGSLLDSFVNQYGQRTIRRIENAIRLGYAQGETTEQVIRRIRGTKASGFSDGIIAVAKRDAEAVARTALQHAASVAREAVWEANDDVIESVRIAAVLDNRTSDICRALDGQEYPVGEGPRPPFHPGCRTTTVAVLSKKFRVLSEGRTRAERDPQTGEIGTVSANMTYYEWLKGQPASVQDSILGPDRGKLLRDGGISAKRFAELQLGKNFKPLALDEMRKLDPIAFERAGL